MIESLKAGYTFFARYDEGTMIATLTLKDNDLYKDVVQLQNKELEFINNFSNISELLDDDTALSIIYNGEKNTFVSSTKVKTIIGEYNDTIVWNDRVSAEDSDFITSLSKLDSKLSDEDERRIK